DLYKNDKDQNNIIRFNLLHKGVVAFGVRVEEWRKKGFISPAEEQYALKIIQEIQWDLQSAKASIDKAIAESHPFFEITPNKNSLVFSQQPFEPYQEIEERVKTTSLVNVETNAPLRIKAWKPDGASLLQDIQQFQSKFDFSSSSEKTPQGLFNAIHGVKEIVLKIPLTDEIFWSNIKREDVVPLINSFRDLAQYLANNIAGIPQNEKLKAYRGSLGAKYKNSKYFTAEHKYELNSHQVELDPSDYLIFVKLLTLCDKVSKHHSEILEFSPLDLYQQEFGRFLSGQSLYFSITDPAWAIEASILRDYWKIVPGKPDGYFEQKRSLLSDVRGYPIDSLLQAEQCGQKDYEWIVKWLQISENKQKVAKISPELANLDIKLQAAVIYSDLWSTEYSAEKFRKELSLPEKAVSPKNNPIIPQAFVALVDLSVLVSGVVNFGFHLINGAYDFNGVVVIKPVKEGDIRQSPIRIFRSTAFHKESGEPSLEEPFKSKTLRIVDKDLLSGYLLELFQSGNYLSPNEIVLKSPNTNQGMGTQQMRQLLGMKSVSTLQFQETLGYFAENPNLLDDINYRNLFNMLATSAALFFDECKTPESATSILLKINEFCQQNYDLSMLVGNYGKAIFFLEINELFASYVKTLLITKPELFSSKFQTNFLSTFAECEKLLALEGISRPDSYLLHQILV
ncbi:MAG: hypothetical protein WCJ72_17895, partial [Chryseobacterium sp.]